MLIGGVWFVSIAYLFTSNYEMYAKVAWSVTVFCNVLNTTACIRLPPGF